MWIDKISQKYFNKEYTLSEVMQICRHVLRYKSDKNKNIKKREHVSQHCCILATIKYTVEIHK